ncbi:MAG: response regulator, partial [candidate division Zixibacteria bacterium]|nr:response regulator [candidate division Zixibacteria bacterium]
MMIDLIRNNKTLVIDDDEFVRGSLEATFNNDKRNLTSVGSGEEGLELMWRNRFFLIICDYYLPGINGLEFFQRSQKLDDNAIFILITGNGDQEMFDRAWDLGVDGIIKKPLTINKITSAMENIME